MTSTFQLGTSRHFSDFLTRTYQTRAITSGLPLIRAQFQASNYPGKCLLALKKAF